MSRTQLGIPEGTAPDEVDIKGIKGIQRDSNPEHFSMFFDTGGEFFSTLADQIERETLAVYARLAQTQLRLVVSKPCDQLQTLGHLQAVWAYAKHIMSPPGALFVVDPQSSFRVRLAASVASLDPTRPFQLKEHIFIVHERVDSGDKEREAFQVDGQVVMFSHSGGMAKFAQPEILCRPTLGDAGAQDAAYEVIMELCERMAGGESPAQWVGLKEGVSLRERGNAGAVVWLEDYDPVTQG